MAKENKNVHHTIKEDKAEVKRSDWYKDIPPKAFDFITEAISKVLESSIREKELIYQSEEGAQQRLADLAEALPTVLADELDVKNIWLASRKTKYLAKALEMAILQVEHYSKKEQELFHDRINKVENREERLIRKVFRMAISPPDGQPEEESLLMERLKSQVPELVEKLEEDENGKQPKGDGSEGDLLESLESIL